MPHGGYHGPKKTKVNPRKQAAQSMMSVGISNLSGSTTSDKKGKEAKKIQQTFQNNNNNNNNVDPIVPKLKPKPDKDKSKDKDLDKLVTVPGSNPDRDDRPKTGVTTEVNKAKDEGPNLFGSLNYNMNLNKPITSLMVNTDNEYSSLDSIVLQNPDDSSGIKIVNAENAQTSDVPEAISLMANIATDVVLNNPEFKIQAENFVDAIVPEQYKNTLGASIILAQAAITGDINYKKKLTDNLKIETSVENYGKNMNILLTGEF